MYQNSSSASSSPIQSMSENNNSLSNTSFANGLLISRLNDDSLSPTNEKKNQIKLNKNANTSDSISIIQKKQPLKKLNNNNLNFEIESDSKLLKMIPQLYERFLSVVDSVTKAFCHVLMCKSCRCLMKKNTEILLGHLCKQKDIDKFAAVPIRNNQLVFRSKPKNRATGIWDEFEEVIEPAQNLLLGYARCKRCLEIIKTSDPKSIPSVLRRHIPQCPCGPFPSSLLITTNKSSSSSSENNHNNANQQKNSSNLTINSIATVNSSPASSSKVAAINSSLQNLNSISNMNTSAHNLSSFIKELNSNSLLNAMKNLTNQNNFNLNNLNGLNLSSLTNLNNLNSLNINLNNNLNNSLISNSSSNESNSILPIVNNLTNLTNLQSTNAIPANNNSTSTSTSKLNQFKNEFRECCIELCYKELVSLDILRSPAFKRICKTLMQIGSQSNNRQQQQLLDSTSQLSNHLYSKYSKLRFDLKNDLQSELSKSIGGALVCDSQDDLCILATYYINKDWKLKEIVLNADAYGNEINGFITNTLNDYHLNDEDKLGKVTFVSRGGHFNGVSISLTSIAHTLDHIINYTIFYDDTYTELIENCRLVCNELGIEVKLESIVENVDWITKYEIMKHVLINVDKYELTNYPLNFDLIKFLVHLLTPFRNASCEMRNCSTHPTLNHVLLWYYKIMKLLEEDNEDDEEIDDEESDGSIEFVRKTKKSIRDAVEEFFDLHSLHKIAAFLWPNFRSLKMLTLDERKKVHEETRKLIESRIITKEDLDKKEESSSLCTSAKKARTDFSDWEDESPIYGQDEVQQYINETLPTCDETTLLNWWKERESKFPKLSKLAKWILR